MGKKLSNREKRAEDYGEPAPWQAPVWFFSWHHGAFVHEIHEGHEKWVTDLCPQKTRKDAERGDKPGSAFFAYEWHELKRIGDPAGFAGRPRASCRAPRSMKTRLVIFCLTICTIHRAFS